MVIVHIGMRRVNELSKFWMGAQLIHSWKVRSNLSQVVGNLSFTEDYAIYIKRKKCY